MKIQDQKTTHYPLAVVLVLVGTFCMATMGIFVKKLGPSFHWSELLFLRFLMSIVMLLPFLLRDKTFTLRTSKPGWMMIRILSGGGSMSLYFMVLHHLNLANATLLVMSAPIYVPILSSIILKQHTSMTAWIGIITAMIGIILVLHPNRHLFQFYAVIGILSGILQGLANLGTRQAYAYQTSKQMLVYYYIAMLVFLGVMLPFHWHTPNMKQLEYLFAVAFFGSIFTSFFIMAFRYAPARILSPFALTSVCFAGMYDWILWNDAPTLMMLSGFGLLFIGLIIVLRGKSEYISTELVDQTKPMS